MRVLLLLLLLTSLARGFSQKRSRRDPEDRKVSAIDIAQKAAEEAKAAHAAQDAAGARAAHMVKTRLAEKALQAAKAAEAALSGKQALVKQLQLEVEEAETSVNRNVEHVKQQEGTVNEAAQAVKIASVEHQQIQQALELIQKLEESAHNVLNKTKSGFKQKCQHLTQARSRLAFLRQKLQKALSDFFNTQKNTAAAVESAKAACGNVRRRKKRKKRTLRRKTKQKRKIREKLYS